MTEYLSRRLDLLRRAQNPDGGWGYFPRKQTWLEPTVYAALALHGGPESGKAWDAIRTWQGSDGSWRAADEVRVPSWTTALAILLAAIRGDAGKALQSGADWLMAQQGMDSPGTPGGWAWTRNGASAPEPTAVSLIALKKAAALKDARLNSTAVNQRVKSGESLLTEGKLARNAGLVLVAMQDAADPSWVEAARLQLTQSSTTRLARAWICLALRLRGEPVVMLEQPLKPDRLVKEDILLTALEALADEQGNYPLLRTTATGTGARA